MWNSVATIFHREMTSYFTTPIAYVFLVIYLSLSGIFTFNMGNFFPRGQADLLSFFTYHPWLYLFLIPALTMRLWAEERKSGSIELLLTLPIRPLEAVLGKFFAAWCFAAIALGLTFPLWLTVNYLGNPDNGVILASYVGSLFLAGGFLAMGSALSALTHNQVIAFVMTVTVGLCFILSGHPLVLEFFSGWAPLLLRDTVASFSFLTHFTNIGKGVIDLRDGIFFGSLMAFCLYVNVLVLEQRKGA
ncbi:MAG: ABC transporter permease subunit [Magnetococcus sp. DMHC-1]|nr:ABC transporter permease subunit [Magnetococcales bacterium]MBF0154887.1 ABC transporter permease subunit [Magnetococcales bacterium]